MCQQYLPFAQCWRNVYQLGLALHMYFAVFSLENVVALLSVLSTLCKRVEI